MDCSMPGFPVLHYLSESAQTHVKLISLDGDAIQSPHTLLPPLLLPSIFPSIRVFSNESALHIRWPKYWSCSFSISPFSEYSGLTFFRIDWFDLLAVQGTLKSLRCWDHRPMPEAVALSHWPCAGFRALPALMCRPVIEASLKESLILSLQTVTAAMKLKDACSLERKLQQT